MLLKKQLKREKENEKQRTNIVSIDDYYKNISLYFEINSYSIYEKTLNYDKEDEYRRSCSDRF